MMTKSNPLHKSILRKLSAISIFLVMAITLTFSQKVEKVDVSKNIPNDWWTPILQKHNIDIKQYTFIGNYKPEAGDSTSLTALELGYNARVDKNSFTLKDPIFLLKENEEEYRFIEAKSATHIFKTNEFKWENGKAESHKFNSTDLKPVKSLVFDTLAMNMKTRKSTIKNVKGKFYL